MERVEHEAEEGIRTVAPGAGAADGIRIGVEKADFAEIGDAEVVVAVEHEHFSGLPLV
jgi:hypothetical protein